MCEWLDELNSLKVDLEELEFVDGAGEERNRIRERIKLLSHALRFELVRIGE